MAEWDNFTNQKQWEKYLRNLVRTNEKALLKSIMLIYNNQTFEEKEAGTSIYENKGAVCNSSSSFDIEIEF